MQLLPVLIIISMIGPLALNILMPSMPGLAKALDASRSEVQLTLSLFLASQAISQLFIGGLADRFGRRPVLLASLVLFVGGSILVIVSTESNRSLFGTAYSKNDDIVAVYQEQDAISQTHPSLEQFLTHS